MAITATGVTPSEFDVAWGKILSAIDGHVSMHHPVSYAVWHAIHFALGSQAVSERIAKILADDGVQLLIVTPTIPAVTPTVPAL